MATETASPNCCMHMVPSSIILEGDDTYKKWRACVKSFLLAQGLWGIIEEERKVHSKEGLEDWKKKNAMALHAIQISCAPDVLSHIMDIESAKEAWDELSSLFQEQQLARAVGGAANNESPNLSPQVLHEAYKYAHDGNLIALNSCLVEHNNLIKQKIPPNGGTVIHVAAYAGREDILRFLVSSVSPDVLEIKDNASHTPLSVAAHMGNLKMVECLVNKDPNLVKIVNEEGNIPLVLACSRNYREVTRYLYSHTPLEFLVQEENGNHGSLFLQYAIARGMHDLALDLLSQHPDMAFKFSKTMSNAAIQLSKMPRAFFSSCELSPRERITYSCLLAWESVINRFKYVCIHIPDGIERCLRVIMPVTMRMYDLKMTNKQSHKLLKCICDHMRTLNFEEYREHGIYKAFHKAVKYGIVEIISEFVKVNPAFIYVEDKKERNMFQASIAYRQERVFNLLYGVEGSKEAIIYVRDKHENTVLHLAAMLSPASRHDRVTGAALQMQRELQWFKDVESLIDPMYKERKNIYGETAWQLFTKSHKDLKKEGEQWMKEIARSCTTVGALIVTVMFSAALVVPGGIGKEDGFPLLLHNSYYRDFKVLNAISLVYSSLAVLTFLGILTSGYTEKDFLIFLPLMLQAGLFLLYAAIGTMMRAFSALYPLMLETDFVVFLLTLAPACYHITFQFCLMTEVCQSTWSSVFYRKKKRWY